MKTLLALATETVLPDGETPSEHQENEIAALVQFGERVLLGAYKDNWTTKFPTIEGHYWVNTKYQENFTEKTKVVMCYLNSEGVFQYTPDDDEFFPDEKNFLHFLGPLPAPEPPLK